MASTTTPSGATIGVSNFITDATVQSYTSQASLYPAENLLDPHRTKRWRSTSTAQQQIVLDLGSAKAPTMIALVDSNLSSGVSLTIEMASDSAMTSPTSVTLTTYTQSSTNRVLVWYLTGMPTQQFVRLTIPTSATADSYVEVGAIYLGTYASFAVSQGVSLDLNDPSPRSASFGGSTYVDPMTCYYTIDFTVEGIDYGTAYFYKMLFDTGTVTHTVLDLHASFGFDAFVTPASAFYGFLSPRRGFSLKIVSPTSNSMGFSFEEAR